MSSPNTAQRVTPPLAGAIVTSAAAQVSLWRSDSFFSISQNLKQLEPVKLAASPIVLLARNPMERAKQKHVPKVGLEPGCPRRIPLGSGSGASDVPFAFFPTFLMPQNQTLLAGTPSLLTL